MVAHSTHKMVASASGMEQSRSAAVLMVVPTLPSMGGYVGGTALRSRNALPMAVPIEQRTEECAGSMGQR